MTTKISPAEDIERGRHRGQREERGERDYSCPSHEEGGSVGSEIIPVPAMKRGSVGSEIIPVPDMERAGGGGKREGNVCPPADLPSPPPPAEPQGEGRGGGEEGGRESHLAHSN